MACRILVEGTSNRPQDDIGNYLGPYSTEVQRHAIVALGCFRLLISHVSINILYTKSVWGVVYSFRGAPEEGRAKTKPGECLSNQVRATKASKSAFKPQTNSIKHKIQQAQRVFYTTPERDIP